MQDHVTQKNHPLSSRHPKGDEKAVESDLDLLLAHSRDAFAVYDRDLRYTYINHMGASLLGYAPNEIIGRTNRDLLGDGADEIESSLRRILQGWDKVFITHEFDASGERTFMDAVYTPVLDSAGEVNRILGVYRDVTKDQARMKRLEGLARRHAVKLDKLEDRLRHEEEARRLMAAALRDSNYLVDELLAKSKDGICVYHKTADPPRTHFSHWNSALVDLTGYTAEEINELGVDTLEPLSSPEDSTSRDASEIFASSESGSTEWTITNRSKEKRVVLVSSTILKDEKGDRRLLAIVRPGDEIFEAREVSREITGEKDRDFLRERENKAGHMEAISTLAGGMAHQFNNALSAVAGNLDLMSLDLLNVDALTRKILSRYTERIRDSIERMEHLTRQLLAYARGGRYSPSEVPFSTFVRYTLSLLGHNIPPSITIESDLPEGVKKVEVDTNQLQMVLSAVFQNSTEAIGDEEGRIRISTRDVFFKEQDENRPPELEPGSYVCLVVEDNGVGMDEEVKRKIFEPFFSTKFQGRGLGMAAAYGVVRNHGGWISVESLEDKGTKVTIWLPAREDIAEKIKPVKPAPGAVEGSILVIEDEEPVMEVFQSALERMGFRVLSARTGHEALEIITRSSEKIELAILDILLPDMDGKDLYPSLVQARPGLKVIVSSGYSVEGPAQEILDAGAQAFLPKPFSLVDFREALRMVLVEVPPLLGEQQE